MLGRELEEAKNQAIQVQKFNKPKRKIVRASDLMNQEIREIPMLFSPVFPRQGVVLLAGSSDAGKSMLLRNMAICAATGRDFLTWQYQGVHRSCLFVSTEDDSMATSYLLTKHEQTYKDNVEDIHGLRFLFSPENVVKEIDEELSMEKADLVIVDAYSDVFDGKEQNNAAQTRTFVNKFKALAIKHECLFVFLHHTGKRTENLAPSKNNFVGSQSLEAAVRLGIELRTDRFRDDLRHFCIVKGNYLGSDWKSSSFVLKMDNNFVFNYTGDRTEFEELALPTEKTQKTKRPEDYTHNQHLEFLTQYASTPQSKRTLYESAMAHYAVSDRTARKYIEYYIINNFLSEVKNGAYSQYQINYGAYSTKQSVVQGVAVPYHSTPDKPKCGVVSPL
ncbi:AAA family ATPase [Bacteroides sp. OttesenSCG-928-D19]|nr:AAA family ATPase [Bacteroides sp. OttesenSCG-928-D19]